METSGRGYWPAIAGIGGLALKAYLNLATALAISAGRAGMAIAGRDKLDSAA